MSIVKEYLEKMQSESLLTYEIVKSTANELDIYKLAIADKVMFLKALILSYEVKLYIFDASNNEPGSLVHEMELGSGFNDRTYKILKKRVGLGYKVPSAFFDTKVISTIVSFSLKNEIIKLSCVNKEINEKMKTNAFWMNIYHYMHGYTGFGETEVNWRQLYLNKLA